MERGWGARFGRGSRVTRFGRGDSLRMLPLEPAAWLHMEATFTVSPSSLSWKKVPRSAVARPRNSQLPGAHVKGLASTWRPLCVTPSTLKRETCSQRLSTLLPCPRTCKPAEASPRMSQLPGLAYCPIFLTTRSPQAPQARQHPSPPPLPSSSTSR